MKKFGLLLIFIAALLTFAWPLLAQTATPTPSPSPAVGSVFLTYSAPPAARIADANALIASTTDPAVIAEATSVRDQVIFDNSKPATWTPDLQALAKHVTDVRGQVVPGMTVVQTDRELFAAIAATTFCQFKTEIDKVNYLKPFFLALTSDDYPNYAADIRHAYGTAKANAARDALNARDYAGALSLASDPFFLSQSDAAPVAFLVIASAKARTRAPDALSWAKVAYIVQPFADSKSGVDVVRAALLAADLNLTRSNVFIAAQTDTSQPNVLTTTAVPDALKTGPLLEPKFAVANAILRGDKLGALNVAMSAYAAATTDDVLALAVSGVAEALRGVDLNLVRGNAFVAAQKAGQTYSIAELQ